MEARPTARRDVPRSVRGATRGIARAQRIRADARRNASRSRDLTMDVLATALLRHVTNPPAWLGEAIAGRPPGERALPHVFGGAPFVVGRAPVTLEGERAREAARHDGALWMLQGSTVDELARVVVVRALARDAAAPFATIRRLFSAGDNRERVAILRALPLLEAPERFAPLATEACRTNVKPVFEALACENAFPARHLADEAFFQMVLKAVFLSTSVARIEGLAARANDELGRMARGYASERRAAGRSVPDDIDRILEEVAPS